MSACTAVSASRSVLPSLGRALATILPERLSSMLNMSALGFVSNDHPNSQAQLYHTHDSLQVSVMTSVDLALLRLSCISSADCMLLTSACWLENPMDYASLCCSAGFVTFVLRLQKRMYTYQFAQYAWTHMILLVVFIPSSFFVSNIFDGLMWFLLPCSLVIINDIGAYLFGTHLATLHCCTVPLAVVCRPPDQ